MTFPLNMGGMLIALAGLLWLEIEIQRKPSR
jgi:hypothetical protein